MERNLRTCAVCRSNYKFCNKCREDAEKPLWYFSFCSLNCHDIYELTSDFESNRIKIEEAKAQLDKLDLSKLNNFGASYNRSISKIMSYVESVIEEVLTEEPVVQEDVTGQDVIIVEKEKTTKRPRAKKVQVEE